jgi:7,8-dihydropterin-6-yl-methyl-4-(beta-D-ribofuranosyl)aminobenzene 5'-phosphate synthase
MKEMNRREFMKTVAIGGAVLGLGKAVFYKPLEALASGKYDIGQCKSVRVKCVSEPTAHDLAKLLADIKAGGGMHESQWLKPWDPQNALGDCALIDVELLDGSHHKFLLDTGWSRRYMDQAFKREGVDKMLKNGEIEFLFISHEHPDHFLGLETTLKYNPNIKIFIPSTFYPEGVHFVYGATFNRCGAANKISHQGELVKLKLGTINKLYPGVAAVNFDCRPICRVRGEQSLYFNVKDKGMVLVTGCCHQSTITFADFAIGKIKDGGKMYGLYGGLHIAPFGPIDPKREYIINKIGKYNFKKIACNHCTGLPAVERMVQLGYPVVRGTARYGSRSDLFVGNGDEVFFG